MTTNPTEVTSPPKPKGRKRKIALRVFLIIILALTAAHFAWKYSGSGEWKKVTERNGVTLYERKVPGSTIKHFKATWQIRTRPSKFVMWASDNAGDTKLSMRRMSGVYEHRILGRRGEQEVWSAWKQPFGKHLAPREFVIQATFEQNPQTKTLLYTVTGHPDRVPEDECCVRVPVMNNTWKLTPTKSDLVDVEWYVNMEMGGALPYVLQNIVMPKGMMNFAPMVQKMIDQDKYTNAKYTWVQDNV